MKTENLNKAQDSFESFLIQLRAAHNDARIADEVSAGRVIFALLAEAASVGYQLENIVKEASK